MICRVHAGRVRFVLGRRNAQRMSIFNSSRCACTSATTWTLFFFVLLRVSVGLSLRVCRKVDVRLYGLTLLKNNDPRNGCRRVCEKLVESKITGCERISSYNVERPAETCIRTLASADPLQIIHESTSTELNALQKASLRRSGCLLISVGARASHFKIRARSYCAPVIASLDTRQKKEQKWSR